MSILNINGVQLDFNLYDADLVERYENANDKVIEMMGNNENFKGLRLHENLRLQCQIIDEFFDSVFGEGTAKALFNGKADLKIHSDAFSLIVDETKKLEENVTAANEKYSPNRAARRAQLQDHKKKKKRSPRPTITEQANKEPGADTGNEP